MTRSTKKSLLPLFYVFKSGIKPEQVQLFKLVSHNLALYYVEAIRKNWAGYQDELAAY